MMQPNRNVTFKQFVDSMRIDFNSTDTIPQVSEGDDWRKIGNIIAASPTFEKNSVPTTERFLIWQDWGIILYGTMAK